MIKSYFKNIDIEQDYNLYSFCIKTNIDLLYITHFSELPTEEDYDDVELFIESIIKASFSFNYSITELRHLYNLKYFIERTYEKINKCRVENKTNIVSVWIKETKFSDEDIFIEFIHNIVGLIINWTNLTYNYLLGLHKKNIPKYSYSNSNDINPYILETFRFICPVRFVGSKLKSPKHLGEKSNNICVIHDLKMPTRENIFFGKNTEKFDLNRMNNYKTDMSNKSIKKCPFHNTISKAIVHKDLSIYENKGYTPFGDGYRRCPGEHLSMIYLEELIYFIDNKNINIFQRGETNSEHFIWDRINKSLFIIFNTFVNI